MSTSSKSWVYTRGGFPSSIRQTTSTLPTDLAPTAIQIRIHAFSLNPVDIQLVNLPVWWLPTFAHKKGIGCDFSGTIHAAGASSSFSPGDQVFGLTSTPFAGGSAAEFLTLDTASDAHVIVRKPQEWSFEKASSLPVVFLTARSSIARVEDHVPAGGCVAILGGSSSCGMYAVRLARARGWRVVATCSGKNAEFVRGLGAEIVVDYTAEDVPVRVGNEAPDAIIDCVGGTGCIGIAKRYVTIVGDKTDRTAMGGSALYLTNPRMLGRWFLGSLGVLRKYDCIVLDKKSEYLQEATKLEEDNIFVDEVFGFEDLKKAMEKVAGGKVRGKVVVKVDWAM